MRLHRSTFRPSRWATHLVREHLHAEGAEVELLALNGLLCDISPVPQRRRRTELPSAEKKALFAAEPDAAELALLEAAVVVPVVAAAAPPDEATAVERSIELTPNVASSCWTMVADASEPLGFVVDAAYTID